MTQGNGGELQWFALRTLPKREDMPYKPLSPYALQKQVGEQYLQMFTTLYGHLFRVARRAQSRTAAHRV